LLEVCVHTSANDIPAQFTLLKIVGPAGINVPAIRTKDLPADWTVRLKITRDLGTEWLRKRDSVLLQVPSAVVPETSNYLFNPLHADAARFRIAEVIPYPFDTAKELVVFPGNS
jgi:RES domain-containing protein